MKPAKTFFLFLFLFLFLQLSVSAQKVSSAQIDSLVHTSMNSMTHSGIAVAVIQNGQVTHAKGYGIASVKTGKEVMALPVTNIEEIIRLHPDKIQEDDGKQSININDMTIPVYRLRRVFNIEDEGSAEEKSIIIIVEPRHKPDDLIGLIVDSTSGLEEIIIKPLGETLRKQSGFAGATLISDGNISLVPDIDEVIRIASERSDAIEESIA